MTIVAMPLVASVRVAASAPFASCKLLAGPLIVQEPLLLFTTVMTVPIGKATEEFAGTVRVLVVPPVR